MVDCFLGIVQRWKSRCLLTGGPCASRLLLIVLDRADRRATPRHLGSTPLITSQRAQKRPRRDISHQVEIPPSAATFSHTLHRSPAMPETPRSSKRRRLDDHNTPTRSPSRFSKTLTAKKSSRKSLVNELDVYDDIDGALEAGPALRKGSARKIAHKTPTTSGRKSRNVSKSESKRKSRGVDEERTEDSATPMKKPGIRSASSLAHKKSGNTLRGTKNAASRMNREVEEDELNGDVFDMDSHGSDDEMLALNAEQQLLEEAAASSPSKRKKVRKAAIGQPEDINRDAVFSEPLSQKKGGKKAPLYAFSEVGSPSKISRQLSGKSLDIEESEIHPEMGHTPRRGRKPKTPLVVDDGMDVDPPKNSHFDSDLELEIATSSQPASPHITLLKEIVLSKLTSHRPVPLTNLSSEFAKVHTLLSVTIQSGESNSMLLIGSRGSGKTSLVNAALKDLSRSLKEHFHIVRLNGFVQTDDKLALREIWRQLGREMEIDEDDASGPGKSYADTLTMLLALLSHPEEITGQTLSNNELAKSIIFIMDEFDLFATHPRQTLLYNLLDIAQSRKAPIAVLGLTTRIDVTEALEKRVKSRFSHRYVHLGLPRGLGQFIEVAKAALSVKVEELGIEEKAVLVEKGGKKGDMLKGWNDGIDVSTGPLTDPVCFRPFLPSCIH
jgi:origin recognition complex subunit 4